ncbi:hypothetical protein PC129_g16470 [Phytophthora cactorum]|uniref:Uncharacterized protein n=1 Tax=Phytophthora cactorum TaxID=29920 RepID=A0A8T1F660_9STRA|nr:hypothetical protein Pcac1_g1240 [Phytophthora cactorum]KAG2806167.1 hypothetical protein PC111_g17487 [Phytophthora cactorum]KAG2820163.1 hypothetical protein PC112_g11884 [Phytophthora cactorum]KAG2838612.1 hypothetical protein PC113_g19637 [Phytophthora cactorum]KAG2881470.1 hypothetical protein PC114_g21538 [Phytophthora cactorum]
MQKAALQAVNNFSRVAGLKLNLSKSVAIPLALPTENAGPSGSSPENCTDTEVGVIKEAAQSRLGI